MNVASAVSFVWDTKPEVVHGHFACPLLSDLFDVTCEYRDKAIDIAMINRAFGFQKKCKSSIDYPICLGGDYEWSTVEFREWGAIWDPCFIIDLSLPDPLNPRLPGDILRNYTLEFEVRVESTLRSLRECLVEAIRDRDSCKEAFNVVIEDFDEMGATYETEIVTLRVELSQRGQIPSATNTM